MPCARIQEDLTSRSASTFLRLLVPRKTTTMRLAPQAMSAMVSRRRSHSTSMRSRPYSLSAVSSDSSSARGCPQARLAPFPPCADPARELLPGLALEVACEEQPWLDNSRRPGVDDSPRGRMDRSPL